MQSIRERIVRAVMSCVTTAVSPVAVLRQPTFAIPRESAPAVVVTVESDAPAKRSNDRMERGLVVRLVAIARDPVDGFAVADDLIARSHAALLADATLGGLALGIEEMEADWQVEDADVEAIDIPAIYRIAYRTLVSDITQGG